MGNLPSGSPTEGDTDGIDDDEITLAEALKDRGYTTAAVGKWHLGSTIPYLPMRHGFDSYFGISNGDQTFLLLRGFTPVKDPPGIDLITKAYTEEAVKIVREAPRDRPFFLYLAHRSPHVPLDVAPEFVGRSAGGAYGDAVEELDWGVGEVMKAVRDRGTAERSTFVVFLSDNGPWLSQGDEAGSSGPFRAGKNTPYEGGVRVPAIAWWPGRYPAGRVVSEPVMSLDLFPTIVAMAKGQLSPARKYYGADLTSAPGRRGVPPDRSRSRRRARAARVLLRGRGLAALRSLEVPAPRLLGPRGHPVQPANGSGGDDRRLSRAAGDGPSPRRPPGRHRRRDLAGGEEAQEGRDGSELARPLAALSRTPLRPSGETVSPEARRLGPALDDGAAAGEKVHDEDDQGHDQQQVNEPAAHVRDQPEKPQSEKDRDDRPEHVASLRTRMPRP